jgi:hypothetical protein
MPNPRPLPRAVLRGVQTSVAAIGLLLMVIPLSFGAGNTPCSGRKGGIDHCQGETFICRDGSVSASKASCSATTGVLGLTGKTQAMRPLRLKAGTSTDTNAGGMTCDCRSGLFCTGPRGGRFCLTDTGAKSYLRK